MEKYKIAVIGCGTLGSQVAFQAAYCGFDVKVWLRSEKLFNESKQRLDNLNHDYAQAVELMKSKENISDWYFGISDYENFDEKTCLDKISKTREKILLDTDLKDVVKDADFIFELIPDEIEAKRDLFIMLSKLVKKDAIITTGSSSILPSTLAKYTGNESHYLGTHFSNPIIRNNIIEIMVHSKTNNDAFNRTVKLAKAMNLNVIPVMKENKGYIMNAMLMPLLFSAMDMYVRGISDIESIDKAWHVGTRAVSGPFRIIDKIGLKPVYGLVLEYCKIPSFIAPYHFKDIAKLLKHYIDNGKTGIASGEGFYKYK